MKKIDKILKFIRENIVTSSGMPTNNVSNGNVAKFDPLMSFRKRKNGMVDTRGVSKKYKNWVKYLDKLKDK